MSGSHHVAPPSAELPVIDDGMRRWYESCSCCLSDAYPEVKAALDAERAGSQPSPNGGTGEAGGAQANGDSGARPVRADEDPVCGMTVDIEQARSKGLVTSFGGREYAFCGKGCFLEFRDNPASYLDPAHEPHM